MADRHKIWHGMQFHPRGRFGRHFERNRKKSPCFSNGLTYRYQLRYGDAQWPSWLFWPSRLWYLKKPWWRRSPFWQKCKKIASLTDRRHPTLSILPNITVNVIKQNWNQFLLVVQATAVKQQVSIFYPHILSTKASYCICDRPLTGRPLTSFHGCHLDPWAAEFGRRRRILSVVRKSAEKKSARPTMAFPRRRRKKISPVKFSAFLMPSSAQNKCYTALTWQTI